MFNFLNKFMKLLHKKNMYIVSVVIFSITFGIDKVAHFFAFKVLGDQATSNNQMFIFIMAGVIILSIITFYIQYRVFIFESKVVAHSTYSLRKRLLDRIMRANTKSMGEYETGDVLNRVQNDAEQLMGFTGLVGNAGILPANLAAIIIAILFDWRLCLLSFTLCILVQYVVSNVIVGFIGKAAKQRQEAMTNALNTLLQTIRAIPGIRWFSMSDKMIRRFSAVNHELYDKSVRFSDLDKTREIVNTLFRYVSGIVFLGVGAFLCYKNITSLGVFLAIYSVRDDFLVPAWFVADFRARYKEVVVYFDRVNELLNLPSEECSQDTRVDFRPLCDNTERIIEFKDVTFGYNADERVLQDKSFVIDKGSVTALRGVSGAGKTTIFKLLLGFCKADSGQIYVCGEDMLGVKPSCVRDIITYVPQTSYMFNDTVYNNILIAKPNATRDDVISAAKRANIHEYIETLENGYDTPLTNNANNFSAGQRQRLSIARALLRDSPIILLDEITAALDVETERVIMHTLTEFIRDRTVLFISHGEFLADKVGDIIILERGV